MVRVITLKLAREPRNTDTANALYDGPRLGNQGLHFEDRQGGPPATSRAYDHHNILKDRTSAFKNRLGFSLGVLTDQKVNLSRHHP
jgi:hypothetical protein